MHAIDVVFTYYTQRSSSLAKPALHFTSSPNSRGRNTRPACAEGKKPPRLNKTPTSREYHEA